MKTLRTLHLYLGCAFAPMLVLFCMSGLWQLYLPPGQRPMWMARLGTIHTSQGLKTGEGVSTFSSPAIRLLAGMMAVGLILTIVLGVIMAFRTGRARTALVWLALGVLVPVVLVLTSVFL